MKDNGNISRKQFLAGSATMIFGTLLGKISGQSYAEEAEQDLVNKPDSSSQMTTTGWEQLPFDILTGAYLITDPESPQFGGTCEDKDCLLTQYFHVYPGMKLMLSNAHGSDNKCGWIGYSKELKPNAVLNTNSENAGAGEKTLVSVPEGVYYLRGSGKAQSGNPMAWVKNFALYALNCDLYKPDISSYVEITELSFDQRSRNPEGGRYDNDTKNCPSMGDVFFSPIGTEIILTFNNANIVPYIFLGENYTSMQKKNIFTRHYGFGYSWYYCKTTDICCFLGASYESLYGCAKMLTTEELQAVVPRLYVKFPSTVTNTFSAAKIRTKTGGKSCNRAFTIVHITDTHGDIDSTHAAYTYADRMGANFVALTGDYIPYGPHHGYNMLHSIIKEAITPTVYSIGNHDVADCSDEFAYNANLLPIRDTIQASLNHPYYYRDFQYGEETIRAISLYPFFDKARNRVNGYYTQEQLMWLCDTLATTPDRGHIFILRHFSHHKPLVQREEEGMFYDYEDTDADLSNLCLNMRCDPVTDIVDAYNARTSISAQYSGDLKDGTETITVYYSFKGRGNSEFVAYLTGHLHVDHIGYARDTKTPQIVLGSLCTTGVKGTPAYSSYSVLSTPRDYGTDSQIAFNVFTFNFEKKKIYVARVGNGLFKEQQKTFMELLY